MLIVVINNIGEEFKKNKKPCEDCVVSTIKINNTKKLAWVIKINSLPELHEFVKRNNRCVIYGSYYKNSDYMCILIDN